MLILVVLVITQLFYFIIDFNRLKSVDLACASVPYTYISHTNATSIIDHFLLSQSLYKDITSCLIKDNHLFSDHVPVQLSLGIDVEHVSVVERPFVARLAWYKASEQDIYIHININFMKNCLMCILIIVYYTVTIGFVTSIKTSYLLCIIMY